MARQMGLEDEETFASKDDAPPAYQEIAGESNETAKVRNDGRIDVNLNSRFAKTLSHLIVKPDEAIELPPTYTSYGRPIVSLNIVMQVVGSRGDVQPFVALGNELQRLGHRVRLATHDTFKDFVTSAGLEFYPIGGDPAALMAYMVKNPGLLPSMSALRSGEVQKKRDMMAEMLDGCWKACITPDIDTGTPFVADAIIANPPSFAHVHCAETLGIPVHIMFTMPWTSTEAFPHPLANIRSSSFDEKLTNRVSYAIVDWMMWQGLGDIVNKWRQKHDLEPVPASEGPFLPDLLKIPTTYCWSPALVPKPSDWPPHIDVCGFFFREAPQYSPPPELDSFLSAGPIPVYIGFGSIVIDDPEKLTSIILAAVQALGVRAIISKGWSNLGATVTSHSKDVMFLGDCPHEWLFRHVSAVVHHGGAGTTACGLANACPTTIIPFFGDQPFWGAMVATAGAGPEPIPHKRLTSSNLGEAIQFCLSKKARDAARKISMQISNESGVRTAVESFHRHLPAEAMSCDLLPQHAATWTLKSSKGVLKMSKLAAETLVKEQLVQAKQLKFYQSKTITITPRRWDPVTAGSSALLGTATDMATSFTGIAVSPYAEFQRSKKEGASGSNQASAMALGSAKSLGKFNSSLFKGTMVDLPLAVTEGLRAMPKLYGEHVPDHEPVTNWKSGAVVAGKEFAQGMSDGFTGFFIDPYKAAQKDGAKGFFTEAGKGTLGITTKIAGAAIGLVAYPSQGIYKSLYRLSHSGISELIAAARRDEGAYLLVRDEGEARAVLEAWKRHIEGN